MKSPTIVEHQTHAALRSCSEPTIARWCLWRYHMTFLSGRFGHLQRNGAPLTLEQIAREAGCSTEEATRSLQELSAAGLMRGTPDAWHSPPLVQMEADRMRGRTRAKESRDRRGERSPKVTRTVRARGHPSPLTLPPGEIQEIPETAAQSSLAFASNTAAAATGESTKDSAIRSRKKRTEQEWVVFKRCKQQFCNLHWPKYHDGEVYDFDPDDNTARSANHSGLWRLLNSDAIAGDSARADQAMDYFSYFCSVQRPCWSAPLLHLGKKADQYYQKSQLPRSSYAIGTGQPANTATTRAATPGEFEQRITVPILNRSAAG